jgi:hypothetical protein
MENAHTPAVMGGYLKFLWRQEAAQEWLICARQYVFVVPLLQ